MSFDMNVLRPHIYMARFYFLHNPTLHVTSYHVKMWRYAKLVLPRSKHWPWCDVTKAEYGTRDDVTFYSVYPSHKTSMSKPYMFRSSLFDHPQGLSFVLSATNISPLACFVQLFIRYVAVCCLQCNVCIRMIPWFLFKNIWSTDACDGKKVDLPMCVPDVLVCEMSGC
jgi:hypothetical protein